MVKKIVWLFAVTVLILSFCCLSISATESENACGDNLTWSLDTSTGTMTITGSGEMNFGDHSPWSDYRGDVTSIVIGEGVTSIAYRAFSNFHNLRSVSLPDSIYSIGGYAFNGCSSLTQIQLPVNLSSLGSYAFASCSSLQQIAIPTSLSKIPYAAFSRCSSLHTVILHDGITEIETDAFRQCSALQSISIPSSVTTIGGGAFANSGLSQVTLSSNLNKISANLFMDCSKLTQIIIPDSVTAIGGYAFSGCRNLSTVKIGSGVANIEPTAFWGCKSLSAFELSSSNAAYSLDRGVLYNKNKTKLILFPQGFSGAYTICAGTTSVEAYAAYECTGLTSLTVPSSVTEIKQYAFDWCTGMYGLYLSEGVKNIRMYTFAQCISLVEVRFPSTVALIENLAFSGCSQLKKITFTGNAPEIEKLAFSEVTADVYYPEGKWGWSAAQGLYGGVLTWIPLSCNGNHIVEIDPALTPTCTEKGLTEGSHCAVCNEVINAQKEIPAAGHQFGDWQTVEEATEQVDGLARRICSVCEIVEERQLAYTDKKEAEQENAKPTESNSEEEETGDQQQEDTTVDATENETKKPVANHKSESRETVDSSTDDLTQSDITENQKNKNMNIYLGICVVLVLTAGICAAVLILLKKRL